MASEFGAHPHQQLVSDISRGDEKAFEKLYGLFSEKIYHVSRRMHLSHEDAEGIVQEVFLKIWKKREKLDPQLSINAYMISIVRSLVIKKAKKEARFFAFQNYSIPLYEIERNNGPEEELIFSEFHNISKEIIDHLPAAQKQIFLLRHFENLSVEEIAEKLNISRRTVENQIFRSTKAVKEKLVKLKIISASMFVMTLNSLLIQALD
jgi:RNA polymerase sigma-70 factor (family 1)